MGWQPEKQGYNYHNQVGYSKLAISEQKNHLQLQLMLHFLFKG